jgi:SNF2 family DNA or RNA helicase
VVRLGESSRFISTGRIVAEDILPGDSELDDEAGAEDATSDIVVHGDASPSDNGDGDDEPHAVDAIDADDANDAVDADAPADEAEYATSEDGSPLMIRREVEAERKCLGILASLGFRHQPNHGADTLLLPVTLMPAAVGALLDRGWRVSADQRIVHHAGPPRLSITSGMDWFELHGHVTFDTADGPQSVSLPELLAAARSGKNMIELGNGSTGLLPQAWLDQHGLLTAIGKSHGDHLRFRSGQAALLDALLDGQDLVSIDDRFAEARQQIRHFDGILPETPASTFKGQLRHYQAEGLGWMHFLNRFTMGGVLADDMGLGKTVQVLAMLDRHYTEQRESGATHRPSLIVAPRSVVFNWLDEAAKFAPSLRLQAYTGTDREALRNAFVDHDIIITSFGLMRRDIDELREHVFEYVVLDEAQAIKNPSSQAAKAARVLEANHRLALTGTPVENHLGDLWSIFEFLNPGMLGSNTGFAKLIRSTDPRGRRDTNVMSPDGEVRRAPVRTEATTQIARALKPFILRRTKQQVLTELPEKTEQTIICELEPEQRRLYDQLRLHYRDELLSRTGAGNVMGSGTSMVVLEALLRLRQAACHPGLIDDRRIDEPSAKMIALLERLEDLIEEGHKALVFSQFTSMLSIVRRQLDARGIAYEYLDGQTRERRKPVARFQTDPNCPLFLISLKAGGLGLNLTAAEYVFILDPWWNPAVEAQAIDRTHRIGQTQRVFAYRLIAEHTVEQRILELQDRKRELADAIVGGQENILRSLTRDDLEQLLS